MTWFRTDDDFPEHVKVDALEAAAGSWQVYAAARTVWHDLGCDCARRRTDGLFHRQRAHRVCRLPAEVVDEALAALVASGLIRADGADAYRFHDWDDYQPTKAELDHEKRLNADRQKAWRVRQREARAAKERNGVTNGVTNTVTDAVTNGARNGDLSRETTPVTVTEDQGTPRNGAPSRPVPSQPSEVSLSPRAGAREALGLTGDDLVTALRARGGGKVLLAGAGDSTVAVALQHAVTALAVGPLRADLAALDTLADWYAAGGQAWRAQPLGLRELASKPGQLAEHLETALAWHRSGRPDPATTRNPSPAPAPTGGRPARPTKLRPAPCSPREAFADDNNPATDPLLGML